MAQPSASKGKVINDQSKIFKRIVRKTTKTLNLWKGPDFAFIELTNACNLHCIKCYPEQERKLSGEIRFIDSSFFKSLIDQLAQSHSNVQLNIGGESLLHPKFKELLIYACEARKKGLGEVSWVSNGMLFDEQISKLSIDLQVDSIIFSVDKLGKANDEWCLGSKHEVVEKNIRYLSQQRGSQTKPKISINKIDVEDQITTQKFVEYWLEVVDAVYVVPLHEEYFQIKEADRYFSEAPYFERPHCHLPFLTMSFLANGRVSACCGDYYATNNMGDAKKDPITKIWRSKRYRTFRDQIKNHQYPDGAPCHQCNIWKRSFKPLTIVSGGLQTSYSDFKCCTKVEPAKK